jgi:glycosyltransferase involved in cell wall biosynthesis
MLDVNAFVTTSLYICYQSLLDPLTQTQVVAYLEGMALAGYGIILLTFEPRPLSRAETVEWEIQMQSKHITWYWLRYHKRPTVPATAWDILTGIGMGFQLNRQHKITLLHARSHIPGLMALVLKYLTGAKLLFDLRGFMAEEYADAGIWRANGLLFRVMKHAERSILSASDGIIVLTHKASSLLNDWYPEETCNKPLQVIPCCVDLRLFSPHPIPSNNQLNPTIVYVGKLGGWYMDDTLVHFIASAVRFTPNIEFQIWTQSNPDTLKQRLAERGIQHHASIGCTTPDKLASKLTGTQAGLSFIKPCLSKLASSPTKIGEYLAAGLPVISNAGIGDVDELLQGGNECGPVGVVLNEFSDSAYQQAAARLLALLQEPDIRERCRRVAREQLDLETIGWVRYREIYRTIIGAATEAS